MKTGVVPFGSDIGGNEAVARGLPAAIERSAILRKLTSGYTCEKPRLTPFRSSERLDRTPDQTLIGPRSLPRDQEPSYRTLLS